MPPPEPFPCAPPAPSAFRRREADGRDVCRPSLPEEGKGHGPRTAPRPMRPQTALAAPRREMH
eukprot:1997761-Alexandrium_andersonii.AAC.1